MTDTPTILPMTPSDPAKVLEKARQKLSMPGSAEVVSIDQPFREPGKPDQRLLDRLDELRERIMTGDVVQLAFTGVCSDGGLDYGWELGDRVHVPLVGAVAVLLHAITKGYVE